MVRASTAGMFDFSQFDPRDPWCWKKLNWVLRELSSQQSQELAATEVRLWSTFASSGKITAESFDQAKTNAFNAFNKWMAATYPWNADKIGAAGVQTEREDAIKTFHDVMGKPGEARYEAMVDTLLKELRRPPLTARQRTLERERRRKKREAEQQDRG